MDQIPQPEYHLFILTHIKFPKNFLKRRRMGKPEGAGIFHMVPGLAQAEGTYAGTFVCQIYIQVVMYFI